VTEPEEMEAALEAILFVAAEPVSRQRLLEVFEEAERPAAAAALERVVARYRAEADGPARRGVRVEEVAGGVRLATDPALHGYLKRFFQIGERSRLSMAALETLAIIAYRQPLTAPEIQELRGVQPGGVLKTLLERRLIRIAGRKPVVGKPFLYRTTREFLLHFGLASLADLPPLEELEEMLAGEGGSISEADREEEIARLAARLEEATEGAPEEETG
jgi:segregation and condensation protein B